MRTNDITQVTEGKVWWARGGRMVRERRGETRNMLDRSHERRVLRTKERFTAVNTRGLGRQSLTESGCSLPRQF